MEWIVASLRENPRADDLPDACDRQSGDPPRACAGPGTVSAALRAIRDEAGSKLPVLGYTVPYAIGNILPARPVIVVLLTR